MPPFMCFLEPYSSNSGHYQNGDAKSNRPGGYWSPLTARRQFQFDSVYGCAVRCWLIPNAVEIPGIPHEVVCPQPRPGRDWQCWSRTRCRIWTSRPA